MLKVKANKPQGARERSGLRHRFGAHLSVAGGLHRAIEAALRLKCDTVQVFVKNQRQWGARPLKPAELECWFNLLATPRFGPVIAHATYLINLASPDEELHEKSWRALCEELSRCQALAIPYLVVHPGAAGGQEPAPALRRVARAIDRVHTELPELTSMLLLESTAGQGSGLGRSLEQLATIIDGVSQPQRLGVCLDTCHLFAAGYDLRTPSTYANFVAAVGRTVGLDRIRCWHLNDSRGGLGSRLDRHEHIGRGRMGSAGFRHLLGDRRFRGLPMILETPKGMNDAGQDWDAVNLRRVRRIAARAHG